MKIEKILQEALKEDCVFKDASRTALDDRFATKKAVIISKTNGVVCGIQIAAKVFCSVFPKSKCKFFKNDGQIIKPFDKLLEIKAPLWALLAAERTALNFLQHLSGVATLTRQYVEILKKQNSRARIYDTRKTTPLLRALEKYAVRIGGGKNHRMNLAQLAMLKDNHLKFVRNLKSAVKKIKTVKKVPIEIECQNLGQLQETLKTDCDIIMLDNMKYCDLKKAVWLIRKTSGRKKEIEISGNMTEQLLKQCSLLDVERISVGAITHSAAGLDISMEVI